MEERLARLERENKFLKLGALLVAILAGSAVFMAAGGNGADEIQARRFVVRDDKGDLRAVFGMTDGKLTLSLLTDAKGSASIALDAGSSDAVGLVIKKGESKVTAAVVSGTPVIAMDKNGREVWSAP